MATITRRIVVCDVCRDVEKPVVKKARIALDGARLRTYSFCAEDFQPLGDLMADIGAPADGRRSNRTVTMAQIESIKKARGGRPRKQAETKDSVAPQKARKALSGRSRAASST